MRRKGENRDSMAVTTLLHVGDGDIMDAVFGGRHSRHSDNREEAKSC